MATDWISERVVEEHNRRNAVLEFVKASEVFLAAIEAQIREAVAEYKKHFPKEPISARRSALKIEVTRFQEPRGHARDSDRPLPGLRSIAIADPIDQVLTVVILPSERLSKSIPATIQNGSLVLGVPGETVTNPSLVKYMLMPVLFPGLVDDSGVLGYLKQEFSPD